MERAGAHPRVGSKDRGGGRERYPQGAGHPGRPHLYHRGAGTDCQKLHRRAAAEIHDCFVPVGGIPSALFTDMVRNMEQ